MHFIYSEWEEFCENLHKNGKHSITARSLFDKSEDKYFVLKHDVETSLEKALKLAQIENKYEHKGSYYVQAYLLDNEKNIKILNEIKNLGHEVSYHYDVMDATGGDLEQAIELYEKNKVIFENSGFKIKTVCQHGNPVVERKGYTSNRDFFRAEKVTEKYPDVADIMVNFKEMANTDYSYISDAGLGFQIIFDPINNDIVPSKEKDVFLGELDKVLELILKGESSVIISTHPHRWTSSKGKHAVRKVIFNVIRKTVKALSKIPFIKKFMSKYYYVAKKL
ncbi:MAG: hypothetical protein IJE46_04025 [Clostridia bacterium]|nr:hypothetical protein [Clostridia bacterium]